MMFETEAKKRALCFIPQSTIMDDKTRPDPENDDVRTDLPIADPKVFRDYGSLLVALKPYLADTEFPRFFAPAAGGDLGIDRNGSTRHERDAKKAFIRRHNMQKLTARDFIANALCVMHEVRL